MSPSVSAYATTAPAGYVAQDDRLPDPDIEILDNLSAGSVDFRIEGSCAERQVIIYSGEEKISLEQVFRLLASLDLTIRDQRNSVYLREDGLACRVYDFTIDTGRLASPGNRMKTTAVLDALHALWTGRAEADRFNVLVLTAGLNWREVVMLRAYAQFLRQSALPYGLASIETVLLARPVIASALVSLFHARFDPDRSAGAREADVGESAEAVDRLLADVEGLDADRIIRAYVTLITATTRTNWYCPEALSVERPQLALKLRSQEVDELPAPRPLHEVFVYSPDAEGVHLRYGFVARGGLRWSERLDDYRTEILGLAKAQAVKNAVIVPAGAKGGFVVKNPLLGAEDGYRQFISGLLDITDNRTRAGETIHPEGVVCHDGPDSYLVVAADKGTASFSDIANELASERGFWLGDAFASGGSVGYDHKKMGITARGAWVSVSRHLAEIGIDVDRDPFTVAGIGDMSGDVFGNGMLLSRQIRLVAAFDHRHIFLDPNPDPASSWLERKRLFERPGSSWDDYDRSTLSRGGGIWSRESKSIPVEAALQQALGLDSSVTSLTPPAMIRAILLAPVDLIFNGGVGTYVKSAVESHADAGDKVNDSVRVDGKELRTRVVVEGGNLGLTPLARIEYARAGGRVNTDAIDNAAGVDCSDHEVNIKILIDAAPTETGLSTAERAQVLASLTDDVAKLVLGNNYAQNDVLGDARWNAERMIDVHERMTAYLVERRSLDRSLESLPSVDDFAALAQAGAGLSSPELATLLAHTKLDVKAELLEDSGAFDESYFGERLATYFPEKLQRIVAIDAHPLRREILATTMVNEMVALGGLTYVHRVREETGASASDILRTFVITSEVFDISGLWYEIDCAAMSPVLKYELVTEARRLLDRATRWFLANRKQPVSVDIEINRYLADVRRLSHGVSGWLRGAERRAVDTSYQSYSAAGVGEALARRIAEGLYRFSLLDIIDVAHDLERAAADVASIYFAMSDHLNVDRWLIAVSALDRGFRWHTLARLSLRDDLYRSVRLLTRDVLVTTGDEDTAEARIERWEKDNHARIGRARKTLHGVEATRVLDLAAVSVAARHIRSMAEPH
ncbi:MAG: putative NAD-dependent glutamate dehydrogenase [Rhodococcus erythropolis]|nr:NAD-glutamate dehydrogenase domain-containing protein [Rhodococcus erythropolis]MDF2894113.1 putative NAD-dependent glutamate dehydrogenase [Rhodococcus erythropolis]